MTINDGIKVHKNNCPNAISLQSNFAYRIIKAKWIDSTKQEFSAILMISGVDNKGIVNKIKSLHCPSVLRKHASCHLGRFDFP